LHYYPIFGYYNSGITGERQLLPELDRGSLEMKQTKTLHLICQAHLDPVWIWPRRDGYSEALTTIGSAVSFLESEPDMRFTRSSAAVYRWIQEADPGLFRAILDLVRAGRWEVVNGWEVQPDCNLPLGESFIRQSLYGKRWFQDHLGVDVRIGYNVDTFGHSGNLPQILRQSGMEHYVFMRPPQDLEGQDYPLLFWWESPDGSRVLCWRIPFSYGQSPGADADFLEEQIRREAVNNFSLEIDHAPFFLGVGNHGGGPTRRQIERIRQLQEDPDLPELRFSTLGEYFRAVKEAPGFGSIPVRREGLQFINVGCFAAHGRIKRANRRAERQLLLTESLESMRRMAGLDGNPAFVEAQLSAWRSLLFNQFHDILGGTCIQSADTSILNEFGHADYLAETSRDQSLHTIARQVDTSWAEKGTLVLFNPLPWKRIAHVAFDTFVAPTGEGRITHLRDARGKRLPIQWIAPETCFGPMGMEWKKLHASVALPACGYRAFSLAEGTAPSRSGWKATHVRINHKRPGLSHYGLSSGENLLRRSLELQVLKDTGDTWGHKLDRYDTVIGEPELKGTRLMETGPILRIYRQNVQWKRSWIRIYYVFRPNSPEVEIRIHLNWQEPRQLLRLLVPTRFTDSMVLASEPGGQVRRSADGKEKPATEWLAIAGRIAGKPRALGLAADRPLSYCCEDGVLGVTLARSSFYAHHHPQEVKDVAENPYLDMGEQAFCIRLKCGGSTAERLHMHRLAWELDSPAERVVDHGHPGILPPEAGLLHIEPASVAFYALKPAEDGRSVILRIQETSGRKTLACVRFTGRKESSWEGWLSPYRIATLRIPVTGRARLIRRADLLERKS
jgi:alpha-mannosidase